MSLPGTMTKAAPKTGNVTVRMRGSTRMPDDPRQDAAFLRQQIEARQREQQQTQRALDAVNDQRNLQTVLSGDTSAPARRARQQDAAHHAQYYSGTTSRRAEPPAGMTWEQWRSSPEGTPLIGAGQQRAVARQHQAADKERNPQYYTASGRRAIPPAGMTWQQWHDTPGTPPLITPTQQRQTDLATRRAARDAARQGKDAAAKKRAADQLAHPEWFYPSGRAKPEYLQQHGPNPTVPPPGLSGAANPPASYGPTSGGPGPGTHTYDPSAANDAAKEQQYARQELERIRNAQNAPPATHASTAPRAPRARTPAKPDPLTDGHWPITSDERHNWPTSWQQGTPGTPLYKDSLAARQRWRAQHPNEALPPTESGQPPGPPTLGDRIEQFSNRIHDWLHPQPNPPRRPKPKAPR